MPVTTVPAFKRGDEVHVNPDFFGVPASVLGRTFVVEKVNPKNVACTAADGGRGINYPKSALLPGPALATGPVVGRPFVPTVFFGLGEVVTLNRPMAGTPADLPYVVIRDTGDAKVNVAQVGNTTGRYVRVDRRGLVKRDLAWLAEHLVAAL